MPSDRIRSHLITDIPFATIRFYPAADSEAIRAYLISAHGDRSEHATNAVVPVLALAQLPRAPHLVNNDVPGSARGEGS